MKTEYVVQSYLGNNRWNDLSRNDTEEDMLDHEDFLKKHWKNKKGKHRFRKVIRKIATTETIVGEINID